MTAEQCKEQPLAYFDATRTTYNPEPDFTRPRLELPPRSRDRMLQRLRVLYPDPVAQYALTGIERIMQVFYAHKPLDDNCQDIVHKKNCHDIVQSQL